MLLMGFDDRDYEAIMRGNFKKNVKDDFFSNTKIVKLAGNSIVVPVLEEIFKQMMFIDENLLCESGFQEPSVDSKNIIGELSLAA